MRKTEWVKPPFYEQFVHSWVRQFFSLAMEQKAKPILVYHCSSLDTQNVIYIRKYVSMPMVLTITQQILFFFERKPHYGAMLSEAFAWFFFLYHLRMSRKWYVCMYVYFRLRAVYRRECIMIKLNNTKSVSECCKNFNLSTQYERERFLYFYCIFNCSYDIEDGELTFLILISFCRWSFFLHPMLLLRRLSS